MQVQFHAFYLAWYYDPYDYEEVLLEEEIEFISHYISTDINFISFLNVDICFISLK